MFVMGVWCFSGYVGLFFLVVVVLYWRRFLFVGVVVSIVILMGIWGFLFWDVRFGVDCIYMVDWV